MIDWTALGLIACMSVAFRCASKRQQCGIHTYPLAMKYCDCGYYLVVG